MARTAARLKKREEIETAAADLFLKQGIGDTSVGEIARAAGIAKGSFYLHFKDKRELVEKTAQMCAFSTMRAAALQAGCGQLADPAQRLYKLCEELIVYYRENTTVLHFMVRGDAWLALSRHLSAGGDVPPGFEMLLPRDKRTQMAINRLILTLHYVATACYNAIVLHQPDGIEQVAPLILQDVRDMSRDFAS